MILKLSQNDFVVKKKYEMNWWWNHTYFLFLIFLHGMVRKIVLKQNIYIKRFFITKKKQHTIRARNGNIQLCKKIHVCNINQFYWPVMMHERPTQDTWANLVVKSPTTRLNPAKCPLLKSVPTLGSVSITGSRDVPASWQTSMRR